MALTFVQVPTSLSNVSTDQVIGTVPAGKTWTIQTILLFVSNAGTGASLNVRFKDSGGTEMAVPYRDDGIGADGAPRDIQMARGCVLTAGDTITCYAESGTITSLEAMVCVREGDT